MQSLFDEEIYLISILEKYFNDIYINKVNKIRDKNNRVINSFI